MKTQHLADEERTEERGRVAAAAIGAGMVGAVVGGFPGAIIGGAIGFLIGAWKNQRERARELEN